MRKLLSALRHPEKSYFTIIVAGTNGKGSTAATLASIVKESGYRTGLYTSPHLVTLLERWKVGGRNVAPREFRAAARTLQATVRQTGVTPTYFEALTLTGFILFRELECEVVVLEVGMGGRLDATNVTQPLVAAISSVSFDHVEYLGDTLEKIAREKAGVIQSGSAAVTSNRHRGVLRSIRARAREVDAPLHLTARECSSSTVKLRPRLSFDLQTPVATYRLTTPLAGAHQVDNVTLAVRAAELASDRLTRITRAAIERGVRRTEWRGRLERATAGGKRWLIDGAHNPDGVAKLLAHLREQPRRERTLVFAAMRDKDVAAMTRDLFAEFSTIVFTQADVQRGMPPQELRAIAEEVTAAKLLSAPAPAAAFRRALRLEPAEIVVAGSLYLAGAAVSFVDRRRAATAR